MESGKLDDQFNLALSIPAVERVLTENLNTGYRPQTRRWEVIVQYSGDLALIAEKVDSLSYSELLGGYGILVVEEDKIELLAELPEVLFVEKPNGVRYELYDNIVASCAPVRVRETGDTGVTQASGTGDIGTLTGEGVVIGFADSGIDYTHPAFRRADGRTRLLALWDQTGDSARVPPPFGYAIGSLYTSEQINAALEAASREAAWELIPSIDVSGHGTGVAGIATGMCPDSEIIMVKLAPSLSGSFPQTAQLMQATDFCVRTCAAQGKPLTLNISFGNNYGAHNGESILETYLSTLQQLWKLNIVTGTGNEGGGRRHTGGVLRRDVQSTNADYTYELAVDVAVPKLSVQLWKDYQDVFEVTVYAPDATAIRVSGTGGSFTVGQTGVLVYVGEPKPFTVLQSIIIEIYAQLPGGAIQSGIWRFTIRPQSIISGRVDLWLSVTAGQGTGFLQPVQETTLTIPATAAGLISVGAYDSTSDAVAPFSGRGFTRSNRFVKPELVAPGVNILTAAPGGGYSRRTGTSFATPFVSGACALLMEWGIVQGNDPYLYGEKVKAYLIKGARQLPGYAQVPNPVTGWGALCVTSSLPM